MLERHVGKEALLSEALEHLVPQAYSQAIEELGDYRNIRLTPEPVEVAEEDTDRVMEQLRHQQALWVPVDQPVKFGDLITMDVEGIIEGEPCLSQQEAHYQVNPDLPIPLPGFAQQLEGMVKGEEKEFPLSFPPEHPRTDLAGKECTFKVTISEVKEEKLPELNDEFAKGVGEDLETLASLRERVTANLKARAEEMERRRFEEGVVEAAADLAQVEFPPILVEREIDRFLNDQVAQFREGRGGLEDYLSGIGRTEQEIREELRPMATKQVVRSLALGKVAEEEKIEVSAAEIDDEVEKMVNSSGERGEEVQSLFSLSEARDSMERMLRARKAVQRLVGIASSAEEGEGEKEEGITNTNTIGEVKGNGE
jgi:trigger factor